MYIFCGTISKFKDETTMVCIFYMSDTLSEARQMNCCQVLLLDLLSGWRRFDSDAYRLTLKDTDHWYICQIL